MRMLCCVSATVAMVLALVGPAVQAAELKVGDKAPSFEALDDAGKAWKSDDVVGKKILVIYFYPADFTGGCTKQACSFRDEMSKLKEKDVEVIGISGDSVKNHELFKKFHKLNFPLLADEDGSIATKFGVPLTKGEKTVEAKDLEGKVIKDTTGDTLKTTRKVTINRWTFVIDKEGKIANKETQVKAAEDSKRILDILKELKQK
jgi:peroxiredoxin Q/BCP